MVHRRWWFVVGVVVISMVGVTGLAGAQLPVPVPTPTVQTPPVSTPPLPKPPALPVPTPPVPTPPALPTPPKVPTVPIPAPTAPAPAPVHIPSVSVPSVSTPSVSTPAGSVPSVSTPKISTPASGPRSGAGSASSGSGGAARSAASGASGTSGASGAAAGPTGTTPGGSPASGSGASGADGQSTAGHPSSGATDNSRAAKVLRRDRALRRAVLRFHGCLSRIPRAERRVLTLRAGVGAARTHSRTEVARITHLRRARVIKLERRGLRRLHALARAGACQDADATSAAVQAGTPGTALPPGGTPGGRGAVLAEHHSADSKDGGSRGQQSKPNAELSISRPSGIPGDGSLDLALVLAPLAVLAFLLVVTREARNRRPGT